MEYSVEKSDLHTSVERKIEELQLSVAQCVFVPPWLLPWFSSILQYHLDRGSLKDTDMSIINI